MAKQYLCVLISLWFLGAVSSEKGACCNVDAIIDDFGLEYVCKDFKTNATSNLLLSCEYKGVLLYNTPADIEMNEDGSIVYKALEIDIAFENGTFCIGDLSNNSSSDSRERVMVYCGEQDEDPSHEETIAYCMIISTVFLLGTACIYAALPELRDLQGKSIINFCLSLGIGLAILSVIKLLEGYSDMNLCAARGFFTYFFLIAAFFWSNAISVQILLSTRQPTQSIHRWREFIWYALYAWGGPCVLTVAMAIVNFMPGKHRKPGLGLNHCWFFDSTLQWQYMYSVMTILIMINIGIFIYTSVILWRHSFNASNHLRTVRYKFLMMIRLFVVMGIPWVFEMIGSLSHRNVFWNIVDVINSLQGLYIFLVLVVFRRRVIKLMYLHGWLACVSGPVERWLAVGDDEEDVVEHTVGVTMDEVKEPYGG